MNEQPQTLSTGQYTIEFGTAGNPDQPFECNIYKSDDEGQKSWIGSGADPQIAMQIIEGLILVEQKRFYHPESAPAVSTADGAEIPSFLKKD